MSGEASYYNMDGLHSDYPSAGITKFSKQAHVGFSCLLVDGKAMTHEEYLKAVI